jgi:hypothetical protein
MQPKEGKNLDALSIYSGHSMVVEVGKEFPVIVGIKFESFRMLLGIVHIRQYLVRLVMIKN